MSIKNLNYETDLIASAAQSNFLTEKNNYASANAENVSSDYAKILSEKIAEVENNFEEAKNNLANQNESSASAGEQTSTDFPETIKRLMPDGTIIITTYNGSSIVNQIKMPPHFVPVADYSAPPKVSGEPEIKMVEKQNLDLLSLLM